MSDNTNDNIVNIYNNFGRCGRQNHGSCTTPAPCASTTCEDECKTECDVPCHTQCQPQAECCRAHIEDCEACQDFHECGHEYDCDTDCAAQAKLASCFGKRLIIASGDLTNAKAPWDNVVNGEEVGLARRLFRAAMAARGLEEDCDYQFVAANYADILKGDDTPGAQFLSGYVDAALNFAPTAVRRNNALFTLPFHDNVSAGVFGLAVAVNKKSPCAKKLILAFNAGLKRIIENGTYANLVLDYGDNSFEHYSSYPTEESHPDLYALLALEQCCRKKSSCEPSCFNHTLLIAAGDVTADNAPFHEFVDGVDEGFARRIFRAVMHESGYKEECDFQFVAPAAAQVLDGDLAGEGLTSGFLDGALSFNLTKIRTNSALFGVPYHNDEVSGDFGVGLLINKKSACAMQLQRAWNVGMAKIICNGKYQEIVDEHGDQAFTAWAEPPTSVDHADLFALIVPKDCGEDHCAPCEPAHCNN